MAEIEGETHGPGGDIRDLDLSTSTILPTEVVEIEIRQPFTSPKPSREPQFHCSENGGSFAESLEDRGSHKPRPMTKKEEEIANRLYMEALAHNARMQDIQGRRHEECTFHPDLSLSQSITPSVSSEPATKRLYEEAAARKLREYDRSLLPPEGCSFKPTLRPQRSRSPELTKNEGTKPRSRASTPTRLYESSKQKNEKLEALKKKVEQDRLAECTFRPTVSRSLKSSHSMTPERPPPAERLYKDAKLRESRQALKAKQLLDEEKAKLEREKEERIRGGMPSAVLREKEKIEVHGSFQDRLRDSDLRIRQKIDHMKADAQRRESEECTFKPQLTARPASAGVRRRKQAEDGTSTSIPRTPSQDGNPKRDTPASVPVYLRLLNQGEELKRKKMALRDHAEQLEKEALTFRPSLATNNSPRPRSPSPPKERSLLEISASHINPDSTPLRPNYNLGNDISELDQPSIVIPSPTSPQSPSKQNIPFYERLNHSGEEYKKKKQELREKILDSEKEELTFQPVLVRSPYSAQYVTSTSNGHTMSPEGVLENISVFERLSLAAEQKAKNEEKARELAKKEFPFQPKLHPRAKSVPKRRKPEEVNVPIYDRLIQAGVRRKTILIQSAKQKEEEELAQCTFQPTIPRESEILAVKAFAEEYQHFLEDHRTDQQLDISDGDINRSLEAITPEPFSNQEGSSVSPSPSEGLRRIGSDERLVRRGSIFDRLTKQGLQKNNSSFSEMSVASFLEGTHSIHNTPRDTDAHSTTSGSTHKSPAIRRDSMLLRPTISSAKKEKDHEEMPAYPAENSVKPAAVRRNSLLLNPTESSRLKDLHMSPLIEKEPGCHDTRVNPAPRAASAPPSRPKPNLVEAQTPHPSKAVQSSVGVHRTASPPRTRNATDAGSATSLSPRPVSPQKPIQKKPSNGSVPNSPAPGHKKSPPVHRQAPVEAFNPQKVIQRMKTPPPTPTYVTELIQSEELPTPPNQLVEVETKPPLEEVTSPVTGQDISKQPEDPDVVQPIESAVFAPPLPPTSNLSKPTLTIPPVVQHSISLPRTKSTESSPSPYSPSQSPRVTPRSIDTTAAQASTDKAREAMAALQKSLQGGLGDLAPKVAPSANSALNSPSKPAVPNELAGSVAQQLFAQISEHFDY